MILNIFLNKILPILMTVSALFAPVFSIFYIIILLLLLDALTGVIKYYKVNKIKGFFNKLKHFQSSKFKKVVGKLIWYTLFLMAVYATPIVIFGSSLYLINIAAGIIGFNELYSIIENVGIITDEQTLFNKILKKISDRINFWSEKNL